MTGHTPGADGGARGRASTSTTCALRILRGAPCWDDAREADASPPRCRCRARLAGLLTWWRARPAGLRLRAAGWSRVPRFAAAQRRGDSRRCAASPEREIRLVAEPPGARQLLHRRPRQRARRPARSCPWVREARVRRRVARHGSRSPSRSTCRSRAGTTTRLVNDARRGVRRATYDGRAAALRGTRTAAAPRSPRATAAIGRRSAPLGIAIAAAARCRRAAPGRSRLDDGHRCIELGARASPTARLRALRRRAGRTCSRAPARAGHARRVDLRYPQRLRARGAGLRDRRRRRRMPERAERTECKRMSKQETART
ncbi:MAG: hypothetical protein MZW92_01285 [Comamonadaceae bacterium]|nr:hypothetical protein [Comamonadaceae bacterium]